MPHCIIRLHVPPCTSPRPGIQPNRTRAICVTSRCISHCSTAGNTSPFAHSSKLNWHCLCRLLLCRDSSVGRASDRRSEGPRSDPGSRHVSHTLTRPSQGPARATTNLGGGLLSYYGFWKFLLDMSRDSSVGRASDRRSQGPRFDPGSRHVSHTRTRTASSNDEAGVPSAQVL